MSAKAIRQTLTESIQNALTMAQAVDFVPGRPNVSTLWRWATKGVRGQKLFTTIVGGRRMVTLESLERFLLRLNAGNEQEQMEAEPSFERRAKQAVKVLESLGC